MARLLAGFFALYLIANAYAGPDHENIRVRTQIPAGVISNERDLTLYFAEEGRLMDSF